MKVMCVVGTRPNFIKIKPIIEAFKSVKRCKVFLVHTGQHYSVQMNQTIFKDLKLPKPYINLNVGSSTHGRQTGQILEKFEEILLQEKPTLVLVVGDVNSTLACSLAASKLNIKVAHVEAGMRSYNRRMPEEINRILTDHISDFLFVPSQNEKEILLKEGMHLKKIFIVGNIMADTVMAYSKKQQVPLYENYALLTIHRQENVDDSQRLHQVIYIVNTIAKKINVVFPIHPRTKKVLERSGLISKLANNIKVIDPVSYTDMINLSTYAQFILTDSGGLQTEAVILKTPCITMRDQTEWVITLGRGNTLTGLNEVKVMDAVNKILKGVKEYKRIPLWDGKTATRIVKVLAKAML